MSDDVLLDAVSVAMIARAARDLCASAELDPATVQMLPDQIAAVLEASVSPQGVAALVSYADELDDIAEAALILDQHDNEIEHLLRWWVERARALEAALTGHSDDDVIRARELALYRGRISGAETMRRHHMQQRHALVQRQLHADAECAARLGTL